MYHIRGNTLKEYFCEQTTPKIAPSMGITQAFHIDGDSGTNSAAFCGIDGVGYTACENGCNECFYQFSGPIQVLRLKSAILSEVNTHARMRFYHDPKLAKRVGLRNYRDFQTPVFGCPLCRSCARANLFRLGDKCVQCFCLKVV